MREGEGPGGAAEREREQQGQLTLALRLPWEGRSCRVLTKSHLAFSFVREGMGRLDLDASPAGDINEIELFQLDLFL